MSGQYGCTCVVAVRAVGAQRRAIVLSLLKLAAAVWREETGGTAAECGAAVVAALEKPATITRTTDDDS